MKETSLLPAVERQLVFRVRRLSEKSDFFDDLLIKFFQEQTRYEARAAAGFEPPPSDITSHIFGDTLNAYERKNILQHVQESGLRAKAVYAAFMALSTALTIAVSAKTENFYAGAASFVGFVGGAIMAIDKLIRLHYEHYPLPGYVNDYYRLLKQFHVLSLELAAISHDESYENYVRAMSLTQEIEGLIDKMQVLTQKYRLPPGDGDGKNFDDSSGDNPVSGIFEKRNGDMD